nr:hypothetical protein [Tanacetum cinerariifolium]
HKDYELSTSHCRKSNSPCSTNPQNNDGDVAFDGKEHDFDAKKPKSEVNVSSSSSAQTRKQDDKTKKEAKGKSLVESLTRYRNLNAVFEGCFDDSIKDVNIAGFIVSINGQISPNSTNIFSSASPLNVAASPTYGKSSFIDASQLPDDPDMLELEDIIYFDDDDNVGAVADFNNLETSIIVSPIPTTRVHKDHHVSQIIGDLSLTTQTRSMIKMAKEKRRLSQMFDDDFYTYMFTCFLLQEEPKRVHQALKDLSWIEAMQEELLQFKMHKFWILVNLPHGKRAIVARIEAIGLFLAYAFFMVYQMDIKSAFLYGTIEEKVFVCQPPGFKDPEHPNKVYKVVKAFYGLHQAPRAWYETFANYLLENGFQRGKSASTPIDTEKPLLKDLDGKDVVFVAMDDESNQGRMIARMDKDDVVVLMDEKEEEKKVEEAKIDESAQVQGRLAESQAKIYKIDMDHASKVLSIKEDELLGIKCSKAFPLLVMMILLLVHFATVSAKVFHC